MIVSSSAGSIVRKAETPTFNNLLLRSDGFKHVYKGLTYKHSMPRSSQIHGTHAGTYTSIGKRTPAKENNLPKDSDSKL
jgi:hypothetical protein